MPRDLWTVPAPYQAGRNRLGARTSSSLGVRVPSLPTRHFGRTRTGTLLMSAVYAFGRNGSHKLSLGRLSGQSDIA
jgi:hypothetical protein